MAILVGLAGFMYMQAEEPATTSNGLEAAFMSFASEYGKIYNTKEEYEFRMGLWKKNLDFIEAENKKGYTHTLAMNHFGDWTDAEFEKTLGMKNAERAVRTGNEPVYSFNGPAEFDWRDLDAVHPIEDQGACGSCWAFAVTGAYETMFWKEKQRQMLDFSEQQLIDCSYSYFNDGCDGGELSYAYNYLHDYAFTVLQNYPYHAKDEVCQYNNVVYRPGDKVDHYVERNNTSNESLKDMIYTNAVSVALEAQNWKFYSSGIFDANVCGEDIDHGVVVTGYNTTGNYYTIKNSWSPRWGEAGYMRLPIETEKQFVDGTCGILNRPSFPTLK